MINIRLTLAVGTPTHPRTRSFMPHENDHAHDDSKNAIAIDVRSSIRSVLDEQQVQVS